MVLIETSRCFEAAHRQFGDVGKCGLPHGHNWKVDVRIDSAVIDSLGYVVDFKDIYNIIDELDHKMLLHSEDTWVPDYPFENLVTLPFNPTCEMLAMYFKNRIVELVPNAGMVVVTVWENDHSKAISVFTADDEI